MAPLETLNRNAKAWSAGELSQRAPLTGPHEIQMLAGSFNHMAGELEQRDQSLKKRIHQLDQQNAELKRAYQSLDRAERLAAVGVLAAGVAHEVGNPVGAILGYLDVLERDSSLSEKSGECLGSVRKESLRVRQILQQLLEFAKPKKPNFETFDLQRTVEEIVELIRVQQPYREIEIKLQSPDSPVLIRSDRCVVMQILLNLMLNAGDALAGQSEALVCIELKMVSPKESSAQNWVELSVCDNGPGVPRDLDERIFVPFFTTKEPGKGTGLGLANGLRLAHELGGRLQHRSVTQGACFVLELPLSWDPGKPVVSN